MIYLFRQLAPKKHSKFHLHVFGYPPEMQLTVEQKPQIAYQASQHFQKKFEWQVPTGISQILWQSIRSCHDKFRRSNALLQRGRNLQFPTSTKCGTQHEFPLPETGHNWLASIYASSSIALPRPKLETERLKGSGGLERTHQAALSCLQEQALQVYQCWLVNYNFLNVFTLIFLLFFVT